MGRSCAIQRGGLPTRIHPETGAVGPYVATVSEKSADDKPLPRVSVVIPVFNGDIELEKCLAAIAVSSYPGFECIVVDDGSTTGTAELLAARHNARMIRLERQRGPAAARNVGAQAACGDILFFVDADVMLHPDALAIAVRLLDGDPRLSAIFGSYDDQPGHESFLSQYRNLYHHWVHQTGSEDASTFWAGCGAIRQDVFLEMGGFSVDYQRPSIEDIELGTRLRAAGHRIRLEKTLLGTHLKHWTFWNLVATDIFRRGVPWMALLLHSGGRPRDLNLNLKSRLATTVAGLFGLALLIVPLTGHFEALGLALVLLILVLVWSQLGFYQYVARKRSIAFALAVVPMQVLFFLGCAAAVPLGFIQYHLDNRRGRSDSN